jgi:uncharacterized repeat protein (TIGR03837 family)
MIHHCSHHIAIFCQVVDNYGDIGFCWRLARQLRADYGQQVTLWVDDFVSFRKICPRLNDESGQQEIDGVTIGRWDDAGLGNSDVVIEAFGCNLPERLDAAMRAARPKWINLEYLSAEDWVESCHGSPSPHFSGLNKYFFFPGFSAKTGGLLKERGLDAQRAAFLPDQTTWWQSLGWPGRPDACVVSLFCYPQAPVAALFELWQASKVLCLVPQGVASSALEQYCQRALNVGERFTRGGLTIQIIPFVDQTEYDRLLWACDLNFVRGEDSFVRAQWAGNPFIWHIYPQEEDIHLEKLQAFLKRYLSRFNPALALQIEQFALAWNRADEQALRQCYPQFLQQIPKWRQFAGAWAQFLTENGDLANNLLQFIQKID